MLVDFRIKRLDKMCLLYRVVLKEFAAVKFIVSSR